jgi:hypothetical protein
MDASVKPRDRRLGNPGNPLGLEKARARHEYNAIKRQVVEVLARKQELEATLKRLKMKLDA